MKGRVGKKPKMQGNQKATRRRHAEKRWSRGNFPSVLSNMDSFCEPQTPKLPPADARGLEINNWTVCSCEACRAVFHVSAPCLCLVFLSVCGDIKRGGGESPSSLDAQGPPLQASTWGSPEKVLVSPYQRPVSSCYSSRGTCISQQPGPGAWISRTFLQDFLRASACLGGDGAGSTQSWGSGAAQFSS